MNVEEKRTARGGSLTPPLNEPGNRKLTADGGTLKMGSKPCQNPAVLGRARQKRTGFGRARQYRTGCGPITLYKVRSCIFERHKCDKARKHGRTNRKKWEKAVALFAFCVHIGFSRAELAAETKGES